MNDLDLMVAGAMVSFLSFAAAYITVRHRANESPVSSYAPEGLPRTQAAEPGSSENLNPR